MKRVILILCLALGVMIAEDSETGKRRSFFGIEGGIGLLDLKYNLFIWTVMGQLYGAPIAPTLGYGLGIYGGFQKYNYEKVGIRHTFGTRIDFGFDFGKFGGREKEKYSGGKGYAWNLFYYALDGLFDFVKNGDNRFGMTLGYSAGLSFSYLDLPNDKDKRAGFTVPLNARIGFYKQTQNNIIELMASIPLAGCLGLGNSFMNSLSLNLGYKYLF